MADAPFEKDLPGGMPAALGSGIRRVQPAISPRDVGIFTEEMLKRKGGKMVNPPMDLEDVPEPPSGKTYTARKTKSSAEVSKTGLASGGSVRGGGCEQRGKTRGKFV